MSICLICNWRIAPAAAHDEMLATLRSSPNCASPARPCGRRLGPAASSPREAVRDSGGGICVARCPTGR